MDTPKHVQPPSFPQRPARSLIGWLSIGDGAVSLSGHRHDQQPSAEIIQRCEAARQAAARRVAGMEQTNLFSDVPAAVSEHLAALRADPSAVPILADAGEPRIVDLSRVCAIKQEIPIEDARKRVKGLTADNMLAIARVTLPLSGAPEQWPIAYDAARSAWVISSPNPNLRIVGHFSGPPNAAGVVAVGFAISIAKSFMQVAGVGGRYFLRDGYHRAYGLLSMGIRSAPAFVKDYDSIEQVQLPPGLLPPSTFLGDRPPVLPDYLDDELAADITVPIPQKMVIVQALEVASGG